MPVGPRPGDPSEVAIAGPDRPARLAGQAGEGLVHRPGHHQPAQPRAPAPDARSRQPAISRSIASKPLRMIMATVASMPMTAPKCAKSRKAHAKGLQANAFANSFQPGLTTTLG